MKVLNLFSGLGGNRKLWKGVTVTAVENDDTIAQVYQDFYPSDTVIVGDAHKYLVEHYTEFDFIWSSPPCQTHSSIRQNSRVRGGRSSPVYPDMRLYQEIIFLQHNARCKWVIENVNPYYSPLIKPSFVLQRHFFWSNFVVNAMSFDSVNIERSTISGLSAYHGICLDGIRHINKRQALRNCVSPEIGQWILTQAQRWSNNNDNANDMREKRKYEIPQSGDLWQYGSTI